MQTMTTLEEIRHSCAHILAAALLRLYPDVKLDIGPPTSDGFYYDVDLEHSLNAEDLERIEEEMRRIIKENQKFERKEVDREEAVTLIRDIGQERYKLGRLGDIPEGEQISFYQNGEFMDLCAGSHVSYTKKIKAFKLLNIAGAYHRGNEKNKQLQRIYGTAFPSKAELDEYLERLEAAKARDHRRIGREMKLFHIDESVGQGLVLWTPNGSVIREELQNFIGSRLKTQGYQQVFTPHIGKLGLYKTSGHFPYYQESQFFPILEHDALKHMAHEGCSCAELSNQLSEGEVDGYLLKPMNCPMHIKIFDSQPHSYRDLPVRLAEFGTVYRWEQSGELNGMTRVRGFTQDDAHIFCTPEQLEKEIKGCLDLVKEVFATLGMKEYRIRLGLRDPDSSKYTGDPENWEKAEAVLESIASQMDVSFSREPGEAAFYGPKIDFVVKDVIGREWQLGTVQVDYNLPERFDLHYTGSDNQKHRPVMIHRAPFGSLERFTGVLIEHFAGNFPTWLAPEQIRLLPMNDDVVPYAREIAALLREDDIRIGEDFQPDKLGAKIRRAETAKVPHMLILGRREEEEKMVSLRSRIHQDAPEKISLEDLRAWLRQEINERRLPTVKR